MKGEIRRQREENNHLEQDISIHIFTVSSAMVGVCLTVIVVSCLLFYWALHSRSRRRMHRIKRVADAIFIIAMIGMVAICALITYTVSVPRHSAGS
ncbi:MAG TPA: hypothetical protein VH227_05590 [Candidatus Udaeobacter sp.]|jgi:cytochrome bd-type quinol oxidase subunit 2|nr:hypothetical protein [Candidatus Udaeobacter sp.]